MKVFRELHFRTPVYLGLCGIAVLYSICFAFHDSAWLVESELRSIVRWIFLAFVAIVLLDVVVLFGLVKRPLASRRCAEMLNLGDSNKVELDIFYPGDVPVRVEIIDDLPIQFQKRDFLIRDKWTAGKKKRYSYSVQPLVRGEFAWGFCNVMVRSPLGLAARRMRILEPQSSQSVPNIRRMRELELIAFTSNKESVGLKRTRRLGHSYEFEQIKYYVAGDDIRSINWKATGRRNQMMVNQYQDERSQAVYNVIDKGRAMHAPFEGLSLVDHAINSTLALSNVILKKHDKAGYISFARKVGATLRADAQQGQLNKIMRALMHDEEMQQESDFVLLYQAIKNITHQRSCIFLYTYFPTVFAFERALPMLRKINKLHLLVIILFENTELSNACYSSPNTVDDVLSTNVARSIYLEQQQMLSLLKRNGIQTLYTRPESVSINSLNKYLELKARRLL